MPLYCSSFGANIPRILGHGNRLRHIEAASSCFLSSLLHNYKSPNNNLSTHIGFVSKFDQVYSSSSSSPLMEKEDRQQMFGLEEYSKELDVAVRAVQMACSLCHKVQGTLISNDQVPSKHDNSLVTVAGECS